MAHKNSYVYYSRDNPKNFSKRISHSSNVYHSKITPTKFSKQHAKSSTAALRERKLWEGRVGS